VTGSGYEAVTSRDDGLVHWWAQSTTDWKWVDCYGLRVTKTPDSTAGDCVTCLQCISDHEKWRTDHVWRIGRR